MENLYLKRVFYSCLLWEVLFVFVFIFKLINLFDYSWWYICVPILLSTASDFTLREGIKKNEDI